MMGSSSSADLSGQDPLPSEGETIAETTPSSQHSKKRRWIKRIVWLLILAPIFFFIGTNVWLLSPWGSSWIQSKIKQRTSLEATIGLSWWIPGGKLVINNVIIQQPDELRAKIDLPVATIPRIAIKPRWQELIRGKREIYSCEIDSPDIVLSLEMMRHFLSQETPPTDLSIAPNVATAPVLALPQTSIQPPNDLASHNASPPATPQSNQANPGAPPNVSNSPTPQATATPSPPLLPPSPDSWIFIRNARLRVIHATSLKYLLDIRDLTTDVPIGGAQNKGNLFIDSIDVYDQRIYEKIHIPLQWQSPVLQIGPKKLELDGIPYELGLQFAKSPGIPFSIMVQQESASWNKHDLIHIPALQSLHRGIGFVLQPSSWQAESLILAVQPRIKLGSFVKEFHLMQSRCILHNGVFQCADFRLIGDEISLLGNAFIQSNANLLGVMRLVASPRDAAFIEAIFKKIHPESPPTIPAFGNYDRRGNDYFVGGNIFHTWVSLDGGTTLLDLRKVVASLLPYVKNQSSPGAP